MKQGRTPGCGTQKGSLVAVLGPLFKVPTQFIIIYILSKYKCILVFLVFLESLSDRLTGYLVEIRDLGSSVMQLSHQHWFQLPYTSFPISPH